MLLLALPRQEATPSEVEWRLCVDGIIVRWMDGGEHILTQAIFGIFAYKKTKKKTQQQHEPTS